MKRTSKIKLMIIGATALLTCGCGDGNYERYTYANREDCVREWGEDDCEYKDGSYHSRPVYVGSRTSSTRSAHYGTKAVSVKRGGFGFFSRGSAS